ncbi:MAG TPA: M12 family metallopeptidase, partial [Cytophagales bacterium]
MPFLPFYTSKRRRSLWLGLGLWAALLPGCKDREAQPTAPGQTAPDAAFVTEEAFPGRRGTLKQGQFLGQAVTYEEIDGLAVLEGDILLSPDQLGGEPPAGGGRSGQTEGAGLYDPIKRWPNRTVAYTIDPALPNKSVVQDAMRYWYDLTNIRFIARTYEANYVTFKPGSGCASVVGRVGGQQFITLSPGFTKGNVLHEIGHAVGLLHEHTRQDRDRFVTIHWANIRPYKSHYFTSYLSQGYNGFDHGIFDFNSRMLFAPGAFALDPTKPTLTRKDGSLYTLNSTSLSAGDVATVNDMYPAPFELYSAKARDLAAAPTGILYTLGTQAVNVPIFQGYEVFKGMGPGATNLYKAAVDIDLDASNRPWIVNAQHEIWRFNGAWEKVPGEARGIGAGPAGAVYIISNTPVPGGYALRRWTGSGWETASDRGAVAVDVDAEGRPWVVDASHTLYRLSTRLDVLIASHVTNVAVGCDGSVYVLGD